MKIAGRIHVFGDHVDTDVILPTHAIVTTDDEVLARHCFTGAMPDFRTRVQPGDVVFAGENFGCGSSREHAPRAIKACGIGCVVARSFARIFYRSAINIGMAAVECPDAIAHAVAGQGATVDLDASVLHVGGRQFAIPAYPPQVLAILRAGGLVPYMRQRLQRQAATG